MKCKILHTSAGRIRVHLCVNGMTLRQADVLEYYIRNIDGITDVKVYDRTADTVIFFRGSNKRIIEALAAFSFESAENDNSDPEGYFSGQ